MNGFTRSWIWGLGRNCFVITEQYADETNGINNAVSCYKEAVQFSAFSLHHCLPVCDKICKTAMNFVLFSPK